MLPDDPGHDLLLGELTRLNAELAAQRRLSAEVVHDLSNPLQVILGLSELLLDHAALDPEARGQVEQVQRSARGMRALVNDLAQGYALAGPSRVDRRRTDLQELVVALVEAHRLLARTKQVTLALDVVGGEGPQASSRCWVDGDAAKLERALGNLVANAVKYSPDGATVAVALAWDGSTARVAVSDEGPGIDPEGQARIFEAFHREERTAHLPGLGLGLFITQQIARAHDGHVRVDSAPGHGATFVLTLPLAEDGLLAELA